MPPRPQGTDGSDHAYRMVIAERYQRMADFRTSIVRLMGAHAAVMLAKAAWMAAGPALEPGRAYPTHMLATLALEAATFGLFARSKLGQVRESLPVLKAYNVVQALALASHALNGWRYQTGLNMEAREASNVAARWLAARLPSRDPRQLRDACAAFELFLDLTLGAFLLLTVLVSHNMIREKMQLAADAAAKGAAKRAGDLGAGSGAGAVGANDNGGGGSGSGSGAATPERKAVLAKASSRARRRLA